jgi:glyoxylase-like metal-dependent hydrolase (beta-lactamase superfamily II)
VHQPSAGGLLVRRGDHRVLIDAGYGPARETTEWAEINCGALLETLAAVGDSPADIDVLALTHLHIDHTGWAFLPDSGESARPTFPNAQLPGLGGGTDSALHPPGSSPVEQLIEPLGKVCTTFADGQEVRRIPHPGSTDQSRLGVAA